LTIGKGTLIFARWGSYAAGARFVTAALVALLPGACGGTSTNTATPSAASSPTATSPSPSSPPPSATAVGTSVGVTEKEFSITLSQASFRPASYTFTIQNKGSFPHNLNIEGPGVDTKTSPILSPGQSGMLTATLQKGSYELWCSVPSHKDKGMDLTIKVG
jgi:Copper binding proteins, plastocyanin/azurin family